MSEEVPPGQRQRRFRTARALSIEQKLDIAHRAIVGCEGQAELAKEFRVTQVVVSLLVSKVRKQPGHLGELVAQRTEKQLLELRLADFVEAQLRAGVQIRTVKQARDDFEAATGVSLQAYQVRRVMQEQLELRYKLIVKLAPQANSLANRIQRQQCALLFLQLLKTKRRLINIDESWLDSVRYHRRCWQPKGGGPGTRQIGIRPRITLIAGLDNLGAVFFTLLQANSDNETMEIYLVELVKMLDAEDRHWRKDTVIIWDNAGYHTSKRTKSLLETLKIPLLFLGTYSYDMAPAELLFARLKTSDLHPGEIAVGKK